MYLLDTNVISELRRGTKADPNVRAWAGAQAPALQFVSVVTLFEIRRGILLKERHDQAQAIRLHAWFQDQVIPAFEGRILPVDHDVALHAATLHVPDPAPERDALIAATAHVRRLTIVTRNVRDFERSGVRCLNPWIASEESVP